MTAGRLVSLADLPGRTDIDTIWSILPEARLVGGVVRDLLAGRPLSDLDLATPEPPQTVLERLRAHRIKVVPTGLAHGTVTAVIGGRPFEITTLRRDVATDGRHAVVAWTDDWRQDAARRDFTINAMSLGRNEALHDYFGGAADLAAGRVRFVGDARARIEEDALRILRFFRFQARYGTGEPDQDALGAIGGGVPLLALLSAERVWSELRRLLPACRPMPSIRLMQALGVLDALLPGGGDPDRLAGLLALDPPADAVLRLAALARGPADAVAVRLRLSNAEAAALRRLRDGPQPQPDLDDDALRRLLADEDAATLIGRSWLAAIGTDRTRADIGQEAWQELRRRLQALPAPVFPLSGRDAVLAGLPPGPAVGQALRDVRDWWLAGGCRADRTLCMAQLTDRARRTGG